MAAEAELNTLKKLESNKSCVNCDAYNKFGHGNICEKFKTFVCSNCKSAHQSFSMRVKSVTMSNWTKEEVDALKEENGGGNAAAKRVWLGRWDETKLRQPKEGDHVDVYKRFIDKVYNDRAFYDDNATATQPSRTGSAKKNGGGSSRNVTSASSNAPNLLDFGSPTAPAKTFDAFGSPPQATSSLAAAQDGWGAFASAPAPAPASAAPVAAPVASSSNGFHDGFGDFMAAPAPAPPPPAARANPIASFDPFGGSSSLPAPVPIPVASMQASFDPFAPSAHVSAPSPGFAFAGGFPQPVAPSMAPPAQNFNAFDALAAPPPQAMGMHMGMSMGASHGTGMMHGGGHMGMGMGMGIGVQGNMGMAPPPGMMMSGGMPRPMMGGGSGSYATPPPYNIGANQYGGRPAAGNGHPGSRDPFAGLGLPGK